MLKKQELRFDKRPQSLLLDIEKSLLIMDKKAVRRERFENKSRIRYKERLDKRIRNVLEGTLSPWGGK